ncbi:PREDICTED: epithelial-stromal interaction protein 1 isoform X2 [Propithecus coquereli]|uniref:epithelial-stromal interaction protein 1 isoform X2 n=1 Tax=Propithecus coquereli TaxID=379532 RepID=UPI00063F3934|nr:PREDICTED: epithelial-stromal interaction protein 1 isoform X2 [Propithecus coquereli]
MYTRSRVLGSGLSASSSSRPAQDPYGRRGGLGPLPGERPGSEAAPNGPSRESTEHARHMHRGAYTVIAPPENRRNQMQSIAAQELANLEKLKEQHRAKPVYLVPRRLGGSQSEAEVRQKQQLQLMQSKYQQKIKREESIRIKKEAEEAKLQKMKAIQREKSNKLEEKRRNEENLRRETFREHQQHTNAEFLSRLNMKLPNKSTCPTALPDSRSSTWSELLELKWQQQEEERARIHRTEHRRVNNAFLDRLQGKSQPGGLEQSGGDWNMNSGNSWGI